jgi:SAM-dependent methyltransferase
MKFHELHGLLGTGDMHPGGAPASERLLQWVKDRGVSRVLEVGAGIGNTAARMQKMGWDVTALEPNRAMFLQLQKRIGSAAQCVAFLAHEAPAYDAIVAESVLFQMDLIPAFIHARRLLRPGGIFAFSDAVWCEGVSAATSRGWHDRTLRRFGIAVASREPLTWKDWLKQLHTAQFSTLHAERLPRGSASHPPTKDRTKAMLAMLSDPKLALWIMRYEFRKRLRLPSGGALESWLFAGLRGERAF